MNLDYNVGSKDRNIRIGVGALLLVIGLLFAKSFLLVLIGIIILATGFLSFCPAYKLLGMNTASVTDEAKFLGDTPAERATENLEDVKQDVSEATEQARAKASEVAEDAKAKASEVAEEVKEEAGELADDAKEKLADAKDAVDDKIGKS